MSDEHESPIKTPRQLILVVVLAFVIPITLIVLLSQLVTGGEKGLQDNQDAVLMRIRAVGEVTIAEASGPKVEATGDQVFTQVCKACHETGLAGAPKFGDKAVWGKVIAQGQSTVVDHALKGIRGMPAKGGNPDLTSVEVERGVVYMANQSGANWKDPPPSAAAPVAAAPAGAPAAAATAVTPVATATAAAAPAADGKKIFDGNCVVCHGAGIAGAPKFGDKAAWAPRLKTGLDALYTNATNGKGAMPPKGGNATLSDADVKAAVNYMAAAAK
jgi:cytochrome c5